MERHVQHLEKTTTSKRSAEVEKAKCSTVSTYKKNNTIAMVKIKSVNINSIIFDSKCSVITANLNTSSSQDTLVVPYKVDSGSSGNIMSFHISKKLFPRSTEELAAMKNNIKLRTYIYTTITQFGRCTVRIENNNKIKVCSFFVLPGNRQPLLGMPDIKTLGILTINCNIIEMLEADGPKKCKTNTSQEIGATDMCYTNTEHI